MNRAKIRETAHQLLLKTPAEFIVYLNALDALRTEDSDLFKIANAMRNKIIADSPNLEDLKYIHQIVTEMERHAHIHLCILAIKRLDKHGRHDEEYEGLLDFNTAYLQSLIELKARLYTERMAKS